MTYPTIHRNGTSRIDLLEQYCEARSAVSAAIRKLQQAQPNGRDYYVQPGNALRQAEVEHAARIKTLQDVVVELTALADYVADAPGPK